MPQSLGIPVVSLAVPNIDKLKEITSDDLSCMWTVFTKCKDNLENGHRLENLSWRLWYRETRVSTEPIHIPQLQEAKKQKDNNEDCPSYASSTESSLVQTPPAFKHVSSSSFKRMITSFAESSPAPTLVMDTPAPVIDKVPEPPAQSSSKFFVSDDEDDDDEYEDYETGSEVENEDEVDNDNDDDDDDGCWSTVRSDSHLEEAYKAEFCKRTPTTPNRRSLLSNMLQTMAARTTTATTTTNVGATAAHVRPVPINRARRYRKRSVQPTHVVEPTSELSQSLKYCVEWEHRQNAVPIERPSHHALSASSSPNWFLESFRGW